MACIEKFRVANPFDQFDELVPFTGTLDGKAPSTFTYEEALATTLNASSPLR
jgi:hypothetical protein